MEKNVRYMFEGKEYIGSFDAMEELCASYFKQVKQWRDEGMPHMRVAGIRACKLLYHIPDCKRWFAGEEFDSPIIEVSKVMLEGGVT